MTRVKTNIKPCVRENGRSARIHPQHVPTPQRLLCSIILAFSLPAWEAFLFLGFSAQNFWEGCTGKQVGLNVAQTKSKETLHLSGR